jgi:hypothetical protein
VPIFNGSDVNRAVEQKKLQATQVRNYFDQFTNQFENEKQTVFYQIKNAKEKFLYAETNLKAGRKQYLFTPGSLCKWSSG